MAITVFLAVEFVERKLKIDDPVGAVSVHGACGMWGVISVGLFADGRSNYGGTSSPSLSTPNSSIACARPRVGSLATKLHL